MKFGQNKSEVDSIYPPGFVPVHSWRIPWAKSPGRNWRLNELQSHKPGSDHFGVRKK